MKSKSNGLLGFRVWGLGFRVRVWGLGFQIFGCQVGKRVVGCTRNASGASQKIPDMLGNRNPRIPRYHQGSVGPRVFRMSHVDFSFRLALSEKVPNQEPRLHKPQTVLFKGFHSNF